MSPSADAVPVVGGLFRAVADDVALLGTRCGGCGVYYFPTSLSCRNPACESTAVEPVLMGRQGRLYSWTVQKYRPPPLFGMEPFEPYAIGSIELPERVRVIGMLTGWWVDDLYVGMPVELTTRVLCRDSDGRDVCTYAFRPTGVPT